MPAIRKVDITPWCPRTFVVWLSRPVVFEATAGTKVPLPKGFDTACKVVEIADCAIRRMIGQTNERKEP